MLPIVNYPLLLRWQDSMRQHLPRTFNPTSSNGKACRRMDYFALAIEVSDPDGDGFNEVLVADEKHVKVLKWSRIDLWEHI